MPAAAPKPQAKPGAQAAAAPKPAAQKPAGRSQEDVWPKMLEAQRTGEVVEGKIVSTNEGGAMVQVGNLRGEYGRR